MSKGVQAAVRTAIRASRVRVEQRRTRERALWLLLLGAVTAARGAQLPVPCFQGSCGPGAPSQWVTSGAARAVQSGNTLTVTQSTPGVILNWRSFNISSDGVVTFRQPNAAAVALNEIFQADPSKILGVLSANGTIYLINQNGILFGQGAQVNVASLIASSLNITPEALSSIVQASASGKPAFASFTDANGNPLPSGAVEVARGASIKAPNGQVMLFGPVVDNAGSISADGGQVILAAGDAIYLAPSTDPNLRGLLVEVGHGGTVTNAAASSATANDGGQISVAHGDVTLVGLIVNQLGRISATTTVRENGSIHLLAQDGGSASAIAGAGNPLNPPTENGTLTLGPGSHTDVTLELSDHGTAVDATAQPHSLVVLEGKQVTLAANSEITATAGDVSITASGTPSVDPASYSSQPGGGRLVIDPDASIDVSGANIELPMESNVIAVQLRGAELADSPLQRNGPLRGQTVYIDTRQSGVRADGTPWVGSPIGDLSGYVATIQRPVAERNLTGGTISLASDGAVLIAPQARLDLSGGSINFAPGYINTTQLVGANGQIVDISRADPSVPYSGIATGISVNHPKWGVTQTFPTYTSPGAQYEPGYVQGMDAGHLDILAPRVVLDGTVVANTTVGPFQRQMPSALAPGALYRPINQIPAGAELVLGSAAGVAAQNGPNYVLDNVTFEPGTVLDHLTGPGGAPFDPLTDPLPASLATLQLRPDLFGPDLFSSLSVFANGKVLLPAGTVLSLPPGGSFSVTAGSVDLEGAVRIPSGAISANVVPTAGLLDPATVALTLGPGASLDVAGQWVNDLSGSSALAGTSPLALSGGTVALGSVSAPIELEAGSLIDVSGGAQRTVAGKIVAGSGGGISINSKAPPTGESTSFEMDATLSGFALAKGGTLTLSASAVCIAASDCSAGESGTFWASPQLFSDDGFSSISLTADQGGLTVLAGTSLQPHQLNLQFDGNPAGAPSADSLRSLASPVLLPQLARQPVNVSLNDRPTSPGGLGFDPTNFAGAGILTVGRGASLALDPGGTLSLSSSSSVVIDGTLSAPAGRISVSTTNTLPTNAFLPGQGIFLEDGSVLSAPGVIEEQTNDRGLRTGQVLPGGSVSVVANRGYLYSAPGSSIDVSGTAATLDITPLTSAPGAFPVSTLIASSGGSINLRAAEGMLLNGALEAHGGAGPGAAGGTLSITLDGNLHGAEPNATGAPLFPLNPRELLITDSAPVIVSPGTPLPEPYTGVGRVAAASLAASGANSLALTATNLFDVLGPLPADQPQSTGRIVFDRNVSLTLPGALRLDAPEIEAANGASISLSASYVGLGYDGLQENAATGANASPGPGSLTVHGNLVELIGTLGLGGISSTRITSAGDVRFRGEQLDSTTDLALAGTLLADGTLTFEAQQLYPTTLSQFTVGVGGTGGGRLEILPASGQGAPVLSAGGHLTLSAGDIVQGGTVLAPLGELELDATAITLKPGSTTSTSARGEIIPFGTTQAGADWVYPLPHGQTAVFTTTGPPAKSIVLEAGSIDIQKGSVIDLSGGGDLEAYEFVPGVNGTHDVLANGANPSQFAIVPTLDLAFAPYDPLAQNGFGYLPGQSVTLAGGGGVAAGQYAILPASYALLPGAYLVRPVKGYGDIAAGQTYAQPDGSTIVAGELSQYGSGAAQPRTQGFDLLPGKLVQQEAQYNLTSANQFFSAQATSAGTTAPRLPGDSGRLALLAGQSLEILGSLEVGAGSGGRGAEVDISATQIEIVNGSAAATLPGAVAIDAAQLNSLGAESLLIGGTRRSAGDALAIDTAATSVSIDPGVQLKGSDLLFTASDTLTVGAGSAISATGARAPTPSEYDLSGDGAFLRVSSGAQSDVVRSGSPGVAGSLTIGPGATLSTSGSAILESSANLQSQATYSMDGASLAFMASKVTLGAAPAGTAGLVLAPTDLSALGLSSLLIRSNSSIDVYGAGALEVKGDLALTSGGIEAATTDASMTFAATRISLTGTASGTSLAPVASGGAISFEAEQLNLEGGSLGIGGFGSTVLTANSNTRVSGSGVLTSDAPLTLHTALLSTDSGVSFGIRSSGALELLGAAHPGTLAAPAPGAGGALELSGASVTIDSTVRAPSGSLVIAATGGQGDVLIASHGLIDVTGQAKQFDNLEVDGPGGRVVLESANGSVTLAAGSRLELSAAGAAAGELLVRAPHGSASLAGSMTAEGGAGLDGGRFIVDAAQIPDLSSLNVALNAGGFTGLRSFTQRGAGDLVLAAGSADTIRAASVSLEADGGAVQILGTIDASGARGGAVDLSAQGAIGIQGTILADATRSGARGGAVQLSSEQGLIDIGAPALIDVSGGAGGTGGTLSLRVPRASLTGLLGAPGGAAAVQITGPVRGAAQVVAEGVSVYQEPGGVLGAAQVAADAANPLYADAAAFMQNAPAIGAALAGSTGLQVTVRPGIEIQSSGDLALASDWDLSTWRFAGAPGILTLRAAGNLTFQGSLSDGFAGVGSFTLPTTPDQSWSYRLVAGANLSASNPMSILDTAELAPGSGNLILAPGQIESLASRTPSPLMVRTGTGSIDLAAAGNLEFGNRASVIYTAGESSGSGVPLPNLGLLAYPVNGGDIRITTGGDIIGAPTNQLVTSWLWRTGQGPGNLRPTATGWTDSFQWFEENVGALAGGDVTISAAGDIRELSVAVPTIGEQVGGVGVAQNSVQVLGGGSLRVTSDADVLGGSYYLGAGEASLRAWGTIGAGTSGAAGATGLAPVVALGDSSFRVESRAGLELESIVNPTLLPQATVQRVNALTASFFSTYGDRSSVSLLAAAGDVTLLEDPARDGGLTGELTSMNLQLSGATAPFSILPGHFSAVALNGSLHAIGNPIGLWSSPSGNLDLLAARDVTFGASQTLSMSDAAPDLLATPAAPAGNLNTTELAIFAAPPPGNAHAPIHSGAPSGGPVDATQARIVASAGDIVNANITYMPKPIDIVAGRDITGLSADIEQFDPTQLSLISAGRDISYPFPRDPLSGVLLPDFSGVVVEGSGRLAVEAGRNINLGTSAGITAAGNLSNPSLSAAGADVSLLAGATAANADVGDFVSRYLAGSGGYDAALIAFVAGATGKAPGSKSAALAAFAQLSREQQFAFCQQVLFDELRSSGRSAAGPGAGHDDYTRGFTALETLFPHSTGAAPAGGATQAYPGDISLYFSRIYSLSSGSISLLAPGGAVDVGIAALPTAFGLTKQPSDLGIVVEGSGSVSSVSYADFLVNQSRVFAADGGNILVWSTQGNIDAGRGAKTAISAPPPTVSFDAQGHLVTVFPAVLTGSGIQALATAAGVNPGDVDLFAPHGVVNAGDAGIVAGNLTIGATAVLGRDNITVSGVAVGVPVDTSGLGASLSGSSAVASSASSAATMSVGSAGAQERSAPLAESALSWLDVFVEGFGEEVCKPSDQECLQRQKRK